MNTFESLNVVVLIVNYNNVEEVNSYVKNILLQKLNNIKLSIVICDNTSNFELKSGNCEGVEVLHPLTNLGYLGGCDYGYRHWVEKNNKIPDYVLVSNTDVSLPNNFFTNIFTKSILFKDLGQIAPLIIDSSNSYQNPHLKSRLSKLKMFFYIAVFSNLIIGSFYLWLHSIKKELKTFAKNSNGSFNKKYFYQYASHGSIFFLTQSFFDRGGRLDRQAFLFSEEIYIGEQLRKIGLQSLCLTDIIVKHNEHQTTNLLNMRKKVKWYYESYKEVYLKFYKS